MTRSRLSLLEIKILLLRLFVYLIINLLVYFLKVLKSGLFVRDKSRLNLMELFSWVFVQSQTFEP